MAVHNPHYIPSLPSYLDATCCVCNHHPDLNDLIQQLWDQIANIHAELRVFQMGFEIQAAMPPSPPSTTTPHTEPAQTIDTEPLATRISLLEKSVLHLQEENQTLRKTVATATSQIVTLQTSKDQLEARIAALETKEQTERTLEKKIDITQSLLQKTIGEFGKRLEENQDLRKTVATATSQIVTLQTGKNQLEARIAALETKKQTEQTLEKKIDITKSLLQKTIGEFEKRLQKLELSSEEEAALARFAAYPKRKIEELNQKLEACINLDKRHALIEYDAKTSLPTGKDTVEVSKEILRLGLQRTGTLATYLTDLSKQNKYLVLTDTQTNSAYRLTL